MKEHRRSQGLDMTDATQQEEVRRAGVGPYCSAAQFAGISRVLDRLGKAGRRLVTFDLDGMRGQIDRNLRAGVDVFDGFFDRCDAMAAGHVVDLKIIHLVILFRWIVTMWAFQRWEGQEPIIILSQLRLQRSKSGQRYRD